MWWRGTAARRRAAATVDTRVRAGASWDNYCAAGRGAREVWVRILWRALRRAEWLEAKVERTRGT